MTASGAWISISVIRPGGSHWERSQLAANSTEIGNLGDCLNGTLKMMDELSNGDSAAVAGTLTAINSACQAAFDGLP